VVGMDKKVRNNVEKFYYDNHRVYTNEDGGQYEEEVLNIYQNDENRFHDPIYNNPNAKRQIYTFGCSWTYGWDLEQEKTFTHLLGDEETAVYNCGAGGTGFDFACKRLAEVYVPTSRRQIFIITIPHTFRRMWFDNDGVAYKSWAIPKKMRWNEYNDYLYFLHNYEMLNSFIGREKIIWSCWGDNTSGASSNIPLELVDITFDCVDYTNSNHPGVKSNKQYAEKLKDVLQDRFK
jgi:hypothetical protein